MVSEGLTREQCPEEIRILFPERSEKGGGAAAKLVFTEDESFEGFGTDGLG